MNNVTKFSKHLLIGDLDFTISINRAIALEGFKKFPQYYDAVLKNEELIKLIKDQSQTKSAEEIAEGFEITNAQQIISYTEIAEELKIYSEQIVIYLLPKLLEYAETQIPDGINDYKQYAQYIIDYCNENDILYDYIEDNNDEDETEVKGFISIGIDFITMGFTQGNTKKKSKLKIIMN